MLLVPVSLLLTAKESCRGARSTGEILQPFSRQLPVLFRLARPPPVGALPSKAPSAPCSEPISWRVQTHCLLKGKCPQQMAFTVTTPFTGRSGSPQVPQPPLLPQYLNLICLEISVDPASY